MELSLKLLNFILLLELSRCVMKEGRKEGVMSHRRKDNRRALFTIYIIIIQRRHW